MLISLEVEEEVVVEKLVVEVTDCCARYHSSHKNS